MLRIPLDHWQDTGRDDVVCPTEVVINLCINKLKLAGPALQRNRERFAPCKVSVMDCSSFSSSSVNDRLRDETELARAMVGMCVSRRSSFTAEDGR